MLKLHWNIKLLSKFYGNKNEKEANKGLKNSYHNPFLFLGVGKSHRQKDSTLCPRNRNHQFFFIAKKENS